MFKSTISSQPLIYKILSKCTLKLTPFLHKKYFLGEKIIFAQKKFFWAKQSFLHKKFGRKKFCPNKNFGRKYTRSFETCSFVYAERLFIRLASLFDIRNFSVPNCKQSAKCPIFYLKYRVRRH